MATFIRLVDYKNSELKEKEFFNKKNYSIAESQNNFSNISGSPIVYWASQKILELFRDSKPLSEQIETREGLTTGNNELFLRFWHEVSVADIGFGISDNKVALNSNKRWFPYVKGGDFRRWSGNFEYIVNWFDDGQELRLFKDADTERVRSHNYNGDYAFRTGFTWSGISSSTFAVRHVPAGFMFDAKGPMGFSKAIDEQEIHEGLLNSTVTNHLLKMLAPTLDFKLGHILNLPLNKSLPREVKTICSKAIALSFRDWNERENSWDFTEPPLTGGDYLQRTLDVTYSRLRTHWCDMTQELQHLERENNRIFIEAYCLLDELKPDVPLSEITLTCNPHYRYGSNKSEENLEALLLTDTMKELISYSVGCMFGRYSLDKTGLILANQGETLVDFKKIVPNSSFIPDDDNIIPILDDEYFTDDILGRFKEFLRITFGADTLSENLDFIAGALSKNTNESSEQILRKYFLTEFYRDHCKMYKKRPIYWLFTSGKEKAFNALIYMHRYNKELLAKMRIDYLHELQSKLEAKKSTLKLDSKDTRERSHAQQELIKLNKQLDEIVSYDELLKNMADQYIDIDLDDGVKVNYEKFKGLVAEV